MPTPSDSPFGAAPDHQTEAHRDGGSSRQPSKLRVRLIRIAAVLLGVLVVLYALLWGYRFVLVQLGPFAPLAVGFVLVALLALVGPWLLVRERARLMAAVRGTSRWLAQWLQTTGLPRRLAVRFPRLRSTLRGRLARTPTGLALTLGLIAAGALAWTFLELTFEVVTGSPTVGLDRRIINLVATLRTPQLDQVMYVITFLGSAQTLVALTVAAASIALIARRGRDAVLLVLAVVAGALFFELVKLLVHRARPPLEDARIVQGGFSFPSGHSTLAATVYGTVAYLLIRRLRRDRWRVLVGVGAAVLVVAIGVSRIYLGVHYPSDVLAGWAAGALWVVLVIVAEQVWVQEPRQSIPAPATAATPTRLEYTMRRVSARAVTLGSAAVLLVVAGVYLGSVYRTIPPPPAPTPPAPQIIAASTAAVVSTVAGQLPHYTEGLTGQDTEPVSIVIVGTRAQLERAFQAAGWTENRPYSFGTLWGGIVASITHRSDPAGPVTPSFLADKPNALAFSLPVGTTFAERHHIRFWMTSVQTSTGEPLWLATASFDRGFELAPSTGLPTHQIASDIDTERTFVVTTLTATGLVTSMQTIQLVPPESSRNFDGDPFHTDGQADILWLA